MTQRARSPNTESLREARARPRPETGVAVNPEKGGQPREETENMETGPHKADEP